MPVLAVSISILEKIAIITIRSSIDGVSVRNDNAATSCFDKHIDMDGAIRPESYVSCQFQGKDGQIVLDQIRIVDKTRLIKKLAPIPEDVQSVILNALAEMFAE